MSEYVDESTVGYYQSNTCKLSLFDIQNVNFFNNSVEFLPDKFSSIKCSGKVNGVDYFEDGIKIYFNGETLHVMHLAVGHTDGDSVVWFEQPNVMHTGDLFFNGRFPYIDQGAGGNVEGYMDSVKQLLAKIDDETVIIPGHGDISNKQEYSAFLAMISETFSYVKALKQDGKTLDEVKAMGLDDKWADWSWNFINEEKWITTLYTDA